MPASGSRPQNVAIPARWKACERELQHVPASGAAFDPVASGNALKKAREFGTSGPVYERIHGKSFPIVDRASAIGGLNWGLSSCLYLAQRRD
jgi:hypothetical protein